MQVKREAQACKFVDKVQEELLHYNFLVYRIVHLMTNCLLCKRKFEHFSVLKLNNKVQWIVLL